MQDSNKSLNQLTGAGYPFDRPVILLAAPRSGSTLLFETLARSNDFWTIGGESHAVFESIRQFNPQSGACDSNALSAADAAPEIVAQIRASFLGQLRNTQGVRFRVAPDEPAPRMLEKTPKNAVRVSLLNAVFPDALYIYLYRNPRENISSMIDAWHSGRFITYRRLPGRRTPWSLLLPPGWQEHNASSVPQIAAFQWKAANTAILRELSRLEPNRWTAVSYGQLLQHPVETVLRLCSFCGVSADAIIASISEDGLQPSRYTLTKPEHGKWRKNAPALLDILPELSETIRLVRDLVPEFPEEDFDLSIEVDAGHADHGADASNAPARPEGSRRNAPCHCGSGKRFKHCHGDPRLTGASP